MKKISGYQIDSGEIFLAEDDSARALFKAKKLAIKKEKRLKAQQELRHWLFLLHPDMNKHAVNDISETLDEENDKARELYLILRGVYGKETISPDS